MIQYGGLRRFQSAIVELFQRTIEVDLRAFEGAVAERLTKELRPTVCAILGEARTLLAGILDACSGDIAAAEEDGGSGALRSSYLPFERAVDATLADGRGSRRLVEEVAFIAQLELRQRQERLGRVEVAHGATLLLGEADSSLRRIRKALSAVESAIARVEAVPPLLVFTSETELSLAVRRAFAKFRARLQVDNEPEDQELYARFRGAGTQIAMLIGWDIYPDLRVRDRLLLRDLQQRILSWLRGGDASTLTEGRRIWQDLVACVELFALISRRQELVEHDAAVIPEVLARLRNATDPLDAQTREQLASLEGLDRELDVLLSTQPPRPKSAFVDALERLSSSFVRPSVRPGAERPQW